MSRLLTQWVITYSLAKGSDKLVLIVLADQLFSDTGICRPSIAQIMRLTGLSEKSVRRCIKSLKEQGCITVKKQLRENNRYTVISDSWYEQMVVDDMLKQRTFRIKQNENRRKKGIAQTRSGKERWEEDERVRNEIREESRF